MPRQCARYTNTGIPARPKSRGKVPRLCCKIAVALHRAAAVGEEAFPGAACPVAHALWVLPAVLRCKLDLRRHLHRGKILLSRSATVRHIFLLLSLSSLSSLNSPSSSLRFCSLFPFLSPTLSSSLFFPQCCSQGGSIVADAIDTDRGLGTSNVSPGVHRLTCGAVTLPMADPLLPKELHSLLEAKWSASPMLSCRGSLLLIITSFLYVPESTSSCCQTSWPVPAAARLTGPLPPPPPPLPGSSCCHAAMPAATTHDPAITNEAVRRSPRDPNRL